MSDRAGLRSLLPPLVLAGVALLVALRYADVASPHPVVLAVSAVAWLGLFTCASFGGGALAVEAITGRRVSGLDDTVLSIAAGGGVLALLAGTFGLVGLLTPPVLLATLAGLTLLGIAKGGALLRETRARGARPLLAPSVPVVPGLLLAGCGALTLLAVGTTAPFYDQFHYQLALPERWLAAGTIEVVPRQAYSYFPSNVGLLYTYALAGPGIWGAQAIHWWLGGLATLGVGRIARRCGGSTRGAWWGAAIFATTPSVLIMSSWAAVDLGVAAFGAAALLATLGPRAEASSPGRRIFLAGLLAGAAFGAKYLALATVVLPLAATVVALALAASRRDAMRRAILGGALFAAGVALAFAPWGVRNVVVSGNPLHPFFAEQLVELIPTEAILDAAATADGITRDPRGFERAEAIVSLRTFDPMGEAGEIGPVWLALLACWGVALALVPRVRTTWPLALASFAGIALWAQFPQLGRYLVPVLVPAAAGAAVAWEMVTRSSAPAVRHSLAGLVGFLVLWGAHGGIDDLTLDRVACSLGRQDEGTFLTEWVSYWPAVPSIEEAVPEGGKLLLVAESRTLRMPRDVMVEDPFHRPYVEELAERSSDPGAMVDALRSSGVTHVLFNRHEAERIAALNRRTHYFEPRTPRAGENLQRFFSDCLERVSQDGPVSIYALGGSCGEGARPGESVRPASTSR